MLSSQHRSQSVFFHHSHAQPSILAWAQDCSLNPGVATGSCCGNRIAPPNPAVATGLPLSILGWAQDCFTHSCADSRIAPVHYEQLGLGTVLARAQACDGVGPAVELPGLRHVVDADDEARRVRLAAPCERPGRGPLSYHSSSCCGRGKCKEGQRRCTGAPGRAERVDRLAHPGAVGWVGGWGGGGLGGGVGWGWGVGWVGGWGELGLGWGGWRVGWGGWPLLCEGAPLSREAVAQQDVRADGLSARPAGGARSRSACPPCAPPGAARSAGRPGLALSSSGAGLRRARRRRRHAPPGPDAGRRGSTPAFQNRRRESEARRRPPAAGPCEELTTPYFQSTSAAYQPFGFIPENSVSASVHSDVLPDSPPGLPGKLRQRPAV